MRRLSRSLGLLAVVSLFCATAVTSFEGRALAQSGGEEEARHHFRIGQAHYESGHFREAAREFEESYRLSQRPALLHNIYVAYRDAGMVAEAADALRRYLEESPQVDNRPLLERRLANLERMAANQAGSQQSDEGQDDGSDEGTEPDETTQTSSTTTTSTTTTSSTATTPETSSGGGGGGLSPVGFIVGGVGAAALIGAAVTGPLALVTESDLAERCPNDVCPPGVDYEGDASTGRALAITTDVLLGVGVAALATGIVLIFAIQEGGDEGVAAACGPDGCMAVGRARF